MPSRSGHKEIFSTSAEDLLPLASPPYQTLANTQEEIPSPVYTPILDASMLDEKGKSSTPLISERSHDSKDVRPTVHYTDEDEILTSPAYSRSDTLDLVSSRASTITTDDEDSEDYDWSGEEDLLEEEAKFEERMGGTKDTAKKGWGIKRIVTMAFSTLVGSTLLAGILVLPGVLVQIYWYKPHPTEHRLYVKDNVQAWLFWAAANLVISWYLAMAVDIVPVIVQYFLSFAWGHVSEYVKTRIEIYMSLKNDVKPVLYAASGWISWTIIFANIYDLYNSDNSSQSRAGYTYRLSQIVSFVFFLTLVYSVKQLLSHLIALSFHKTAYSDRIESVREALKVVEQLRQYRPKSAKKSPGTKSPTFGSISSPLSLSDSEHYIALNSALRSAASPVTSFVHSKLRQSVVIEEEDNDADHEGQEGHSGHREGKKKEHHRVWFSRSQHPPALSDPEQGHMHEDEHEFEAIPLKSGSRPTSPSLGHHTEGSSSHVYPPSTISSDDHGNTEPSTFAQAAHVLKSAVLHDARNLRGKNLAEGSMIWNVNSSREAKRLARAIYTRLRPRGRTYLIPSDFYPAFADQESAKAAFRVFDKDDNGDISRAEIKTKLVKIYKERRALSRSMRDVGAALKTLDTIILCFAMVILFFISLSVFGVDITSSLSSVYSLAIAASFIFKNAASSAFDSIMFLFVTHLTMQVTWRTPWEKLELLEKHMNEWLSTEENRWYAPSTSVVLQHIEYQRYMTLTMGISHNGRCVDVLLSELGSSQQEENCLSRSGAILLSPTGHHILRVTHPTKPELPRPPASPSWLTADAEDPTPSLDAKAPSQAEPVRPLLGFLPPVGTRTSHLRSRRTRSRKAAMRGLDAD
ncbi:hypothetical protein H0H93_003325 [Arthromyces matolae]|nr:hypothetical protein H0H93_003325 [Arthromyces matolae]